MSPDLLHHGLQLLRNSVFLYAAFLVTVAVHELGHWSAASWAGFPLRELRIAFVKWSAQEGWKPMWGGWSILSGCILVQAAHADRCFRLRWISFVLAGPSANVFFGCLCVMFSRFPGGAGTYAKLSAVMSFALTALNILPFRNAKLATDGLQFFCALFNTRRYRRARFMARFADASVVLTGLLRSGDLQVAHKLACDLSGEALRVDASEQVQASLAGVLDLCTRYLKPTEDASGSHAQ